MPLPHANNALDPDSANADSADRSGPPAMPWIGFLAPVVCALTVFADRAVRTAQGEASELSLLQGLSLAALVAWFVYYGDRLSSLLRYGKAAVP